MMKYILCGILFFAFCTSCTKSEEGLIGEWEGTTDRVDSDGNLIEATIKCVIRSNSNSYRSIELTVAGVLLEFEARENVNTLLYKDKPILNDSLRISYITGSAELLNDTLLHFDHTVYTMKNGALVHSDDERFDMVRK